MKTDSRRSNEKFFVSTFGLLLLLLATCPRSAVAQTNTFPASGNAGIGTTSPGNPLQVTNSSGTSAGVRVDAVTATSGNGGALVLNTPSGSNHLMFETSGVQKWIQYVSGNDLRFWATGAGDRLTLQSNGNVGIGTTTPSSLLHLRSASHTYLQIGAPFAYQSSISLSDDSNGEDIVLYRPENTRDFSIWTANSSRVVTVTQGGNVGIGTISPTKKLDVVGDVNASGSITGGTIVAKYQDVAEWVESSEQLAAGTVVVLDETKSNQVIASSHAYDTRVAGVISAQPGITLGEKSDSKVLVATTGRVKVRVDASSGPIQVGDLLVTSDIAGVAKKSEPLLLGGVPIHRPGTLIGKALEPLAKGRGEILVLLSLQ